MPQRSQGVASLVRHVCGLKERDRSLMASNVLPMSSLSSFLLALFDWMYALGSTPSMSLVIDSLSF